MRITSGISNITSIPTRPHNGLQNLNNNDHPFYSAVPARIVTTTFTQGLDASKSATPAIGNIYYATDTTKLYQCFATNVWVQVDDICVPSSPSQGDTIYYDSVKWNRLPAGTSGQFLQSLGAGANPQWASVATPVATGSKTGTPYTMVVSASPGTALDTTNLKIIFTGAVGQVVRITAFAAMQVVVGINQSVAVNIVDVTNSVGVLTLCSGGGVTNGTFQGYGLQQAFYTLQSTSTTFEMYGYNQHASNSATVYNNATQSAPVSFGVSQSATSGASIILNDNLNNSSFPWFVVESI